jgi:hypothetical protein
LLAIRSSNYKVGNRWAFATGPLYFAGRYSSRDAWAASLENWADGRYWFRTSGLFDRVGSQRVIYLLGTFPATPLRTVRATFIAYGSPKVPTRGSTHQERSLSTASSTRRVVDTLGAEPGGNKLNTLYHNRRFPNFIMAVCLTGPLCSFSLTS